MTTPDSVTPADTMIWAEEDPAAKGTPLPGLKSCDAALAMAKEQMSKIDVVSTMDTPEEFAAFWLEVGKKAGFEPLSDPSQELFNSRAETTEEPAISDEDRAELVSANTCSARLTDLARERNRQVDTTLINGITVKDDVSKLLTKWGGVKRVAEALKERERPGGALAMGRRSMSLSNSTMIGASPTKASAS